MAVSSLPDAMPWFLDFCGVPLGHNHYVHHLIGTHLKEFPGIEVIIELGTGVGGLSLFCGLLGIRYGLDVHTFDVTRHFDQPTAELMAFLKVRYHEVDLFSAAGQAEVWGAIDGRKTYLVCDNGNKRSEFQTYVPPLRPGSLVSVHDYGLEFFEEDANLPGLEPVGRDEWLKHQCLYATWRVAGENSTIGSPT